MKILTQTQADKLEAKLRRPGRMLSRVVQEDKTYIDYTTAQPKTARVLSRISPRSRKKSQHYVVVADSKPSN